MPIVCTTCVVILPPQNLGQLAHHEFVHRKQRHDRRKRRSDCFRHVILRNPKTGIVYLVYANGKVVILGPKGPEEIAHATTWIQLILCCRARGNVSLKNVVYVYSINGMDGLSDLFTRLRPIYPMLQHDPELSPALMFNPDCCENAKVMVFRTGKVNITGIKSFDQIDIIKRELAQVL